MLNQPQIPPLTPTPERRPGQRGDTTETYVRHAQDRADRGASPVPPSDADSGASDTPVDQGGGGVMAFLGRLWPFRRAG